MTYWISLRDVRPWRDPRSTTFWLIAKDGLVTEAAPGAAWTIGHETVTVLDHYRRQGANIDWIQSD